MKKIIWASLMLAPFLSPAQQAGYHISVHLQPLPAPAKAYLVTHFGWTSQVILDSADATKGVFTFQGNSVDPVKTHIVIDHMGKGVSNQGKYPDALVVYLEKGHIQITGKDSIKTAKVTGSALNTEYAQYYADVLALLETTNHTIDQAYANASDTQRRSKPFTDSLVAIMRRDWQEVDRRKQAYIQAHPSSFLSLEAVTELAGNHVDVEKIEPVYRSLGPEWKHTAMAKKLAAVLYDTGPGALGTIAPDFTQNNVNGQPVKLSDFKGRYVLLDFWASWCGPCRAENPNVRKAYNTYKDRNFTILAVSLDQSDKKEAWLQAIAKDSLPWTQVSDLQGWNNAAARQYNIRAIPQNFLIDPSGKIIAKNLRGEALEQRLAKVLP